MSSVSDIKLIRTDFFFHKSVYLYTILFTTLFQIQETERKKKKKTIQNQKTKLRKQVKLKKHLKSLSNTHPVRSKQPIGKQIPPAKVLDAKTNKILEQKSLILTRGTNSAKTSDIHEINLNRQFQKSILHGTKTR